MKRLPTLLAALLIMNACNPSTMVPFKEIKNYFVRNDAPIASTQIVINSQEQFDSIFGPAAFMGKDGEPTPIDFSKETVVAIVEPTTDIATELEALSLTKTPGLPGTGNALVFRYKSSKGERQSFTIRPTLIISVDNEHLTGLFRFIKEEGLVASVNPAEYKSINQENMQQVRDFLHKAGVYFLATVDGDQPQVRPFGTAEIIEGKLYIQTGHVKNVAKQIAANPKAAICAYDGERWIRITATLVEDPRVEIKKAMLDANPGLRSMYDENDDNTAVYFLKDARATISSFTAAPVEINF